MILIKKKLIEQGFEEKFLTVKKTYVAYKGVVAFYYATDFIDLIEYCAFFVNFDATNFLYRDVTQRDIDAYIEETYHDILTDSDSTHYRSTYPTQTRKILKFQKEGKL